MIHFTQTKKLSVDMSITKEIIREKLTNNEPIIVVMRNHHSHMIVQEFAKFEPEELGSSPLFTNPIIKDDIVLCQDETGKLFRFKIDDLELVNK